MSAITNGKTLLPNPALDSSKTDALQNAWGKQIFAHISEQPHEERNLSLKRQKTETGTSVSELSNTIIIPPSLNSFLELDSNFLNQQQEIELVNLNQIDNCFQIEEALVERRKENAEILQDIKKLATQFTTNSCRFFFKKAMERWKDIPVASWPNRVPGEWVVEFLELAKRDFPTYGEMDVCMAIYLLSHVLNWIKKIAIDVKQLKSNEPSLMVDELIERNLVRNFNFKQREVQLQTKEATISELLATIYAVLFITSDFSQNDVPDLKYRIDFYKKDYDYSDKKHQANPIDLLITRLQAQIQTIEEKIKGNQLSGEQLQQAQACISALNQKIKHITENKLELMKKQIDAELNFLQFCLQIFLVAMPSEKAASYLNFLFESTRKIEVKEGHFNLPEGFGEIVTIMQSLTKKLSLEEGQNWLCSKFLCLLSAFLESDSGLRNTKLDLCQKMQQRLYTTNFFKEMPFFQKIESLLDEISKTPSPYSHYSHLLSVRSHLELKENLLLKLKKEGYPCKDESFLKLVDFFYKIWWFSPGLQLKTFYEKTIEWIVCELVSKESFADESKLIAAVEKEFQAKYHEGAFDFSYCKNLTINYFKLRPISSP